MADKTTKARQMVPFQARAAVGALAPVAEVRRPAARRAVSAIARQAVNERHRLTALAAAAALGASERFGMNLPEIPVVGRAGTYGLAAYALAKVTKSETMSHVATGLLSVAVHDLARGGGSPAAAKPAVVGDDVGDSETIMGEI
jgi:hypothetical protein